jgi:hypothetical protein
VKWKTLEAKMRAGAKDGSVAAGVAGVPHLKDFNTEMAAGHLVKFGEFRGHILSLYSGSRDFGVLSDAQRAVWSTLAADYAADPEAFKVKHAKEEEVFRDMKKTFAPLSYAGRVFLPSDFKSGVCSPLHWIYVVRAHARGKVHFKGKTLEEQGAYVQKILEHAPVFCEMAGIIVSVAASVEPAATV